MRGLAIPVLVLWYIVSGAVPTSELITVRLGERPPNELGPALASISADGRLVAFSSRLRLAVEDVDDSEDLYLLDVQTRRTVLESRKPGWADRYRSISHPKISGDGHVIVFQATVDNVPGQPHAVWQVVRLDRRDGTATLVSADPSGSPADGDCSQPAISAEGGAVVFASAGTNLVAAGDANGITSDIYLARATQSGVTRVSVGNDGAQLKRGYSVSPAVSADGRYVAFSSTAELTCADTAGCSTGASGRKPVAEVYVRDLVANTTSRVSRAAPDRRPKGHAAWPSISGDGRYVAFVSEAPNLVRGDANRQADIFLHDRQTGTTTLVSRRPDGRSGNGASRHPSISTDGKRIAFQSVASDLVCAARCRPGDSDINMLWDVFVFDRESGAMLRASRDGGSEWLEPSRGPAMNATGDVLVFTSRHPIDSEDDRHDEDLYVRATLFNRR